MLKVARLYQVALAIILTLGGVFFTQSANAQTIGVTVVLQVRISTGLQM
jgi:hypothetical protein